MCPAIDPAPGCAEIVLHIDERWRRDMMYEGAMIAATATATATATVHKQTVVTRHIADFANFNVHRS